MSRSDRWGDVEDLLLLGRVLLSSRCWAAFWRSSHVVCGRRWRSAWPSALPVRARRAVPRRIALVAVLEAEGSAGTGFVLHFLESLVDVLATHVVDLGDRFHGQTVDLVR